ncbi:hypothetical protein [Pseudomonas aeruginosa]|uniref:hypothetical protein n=1 Tax=Pseudomonas aeruginosa TaxID=287 RepID=UPI0022EAB2EC|nr:hypothetical protein [Pseudomonas aeruginosa]MDA3270692.1 hypothetical protein [Pseudomonas aeruginosa]
MKKSKGLVATEIQRLAQANGVSAERDGLSRMALTITCLAGDSVSLDSVEQMSSPNSPSKATPLPW